jgi:hypothetical protein
MRATRSTSAIQPVNCRSVRIVDGGKDVHAAVSSVGTTFFASRYSERVGTIVLARRSKPTLKQPAKAVRGALIKLKLIWLRFTG